MGKHSKSDGHEEQRPLTLTWKEMQFVIEKIDVISLIYRVISRKGDKRKKKGWYIELYWQRCGVQNRGGSTSQWCVLVRTALGCCHAVLAVSQQEGYYQ